MRPLVPLCSLASLLLACTAPLEIETIELADPPAPAPALPGWSHQPDAAPPPANPEHQPRLEVKLVALEQDHVDYFCPYVVESRGFPAIDVAGTMLVDVEAHVDSNSDGEDEYMLLSVFVPGQLPREQLVFDRGDDFEFDESTRTSISHCDAALEQLREEVDIINAELASRTWRALGYLDVVGVDAYMAAGQNLDQRIEALPLDQRPVEVLYRGGHFIARVRQAEVLVEIERPRWRGLSEICSRTPKINYVLADRATGLALVMFDHYNGACTCPMHEYADVVQLPSSLFAEVDRRPSSALPPSPDEDDDAYAY